MSRALGLVFGRLEVRRSPGIQTPYTLDDLCDGINIIHGPNASGKTTSAQAIHALLWPDPPCWPRGALSGLLHFDGSEWLLDFDAGRFHCQRDGVDGTRLGISGPETRDRYILTLHDLLQADNESFAEAILRESVGGYDVDASVGQLGYRESPSRPASLLNRLTDARTKRQTAQQTQLNLVKEQEKLADLRSRRDDARDARDLIDLLERAIRVKEAKLAVEDAHRVVANFPQSLEHLRGDEIGALNDLRTRLSDYRERRDRERSAIESAQTAVAETRLDGIPAQPGLIGTLRARCQTLQDLAGQIDREERVWRDAGEQRESARSRIRDRIQESQLHEIEATGLRELGELVKQFESAHAEETAQAALQDWLGDIVPPSNLDQLREGISCLNRWLKAPEAGSARADAQLVRVARIAATLVIILSLLLAVLASWFFAVVAVVGAGLLFVARPASTDVHSAQLKNIQDNYNRLGLERVETWTSERVEKLLDRLNDELRRGIVDEEKARRWDRLAQKHAAATEARTTLELQRDRLTARYGLTPTNSSDLHLLAENLDRWQQADVAARRAKGNLDKAISERDGLLDTINQELARFGYQPAADHAVVLKSIEHLDGRLQSFTDACRTIEEKRHSLDDDVLPEIDRIDRQIRRLFEQLDLSEDDDQALHELVRQSDAYTRAKSDREQAVYELQSAESRLGDHDNLRQQELSELEAERIRVQELADQYDDLHKQVVAIETRVEDAKEKHDIESAVSAEADALDALRAERENQYRLVAGWSLGEFIRQQTRDRDRPRVFHRARELFSRITYGRYRLELAGNPEPRFRATDTTTSVGLGLDELSSATRVQLLMAVRMAFVEEMEQGAKLPLILDEVLGNSDESRARAIIDATIEICRSGRQVFYFTAQHDEVAKWIQVLDDHQDVTYREIDLAEARGLADIERLPSLKIVTPQFPAIPLPEGTTRFEYRDTIGVPGIDPWADIGSVHLWYLVHNNEALYHLLQNHVHVWGQLKTLVDLGGAPLLEHYPGTFERAEARVKIIRAARDAWRIGRCRRIDRSVLLDSNAITDRFVDEVSQVSDGLNGNAAALIAALEGGQVKGFRRASIDELQSFCRDHGYISDIEPLSDDDLWGRVVAAVANEMSAGLIDSDDIEELIGSISAPAGASI